MPDISQTRAVFVHGSPETAAIWGPLLAELQHPDTVTLSPPGFGAPVPAGFGTTADEYAAWLASELERQRAPVDLVGHDWGAGHVMRIAMARPDLIRSWVMEQGASLTGAPGPFHRNRQPRRPRPNSPERDSLSRDLLPPNNKPAGLTPIPAHHETLPSGS